MGSSIETSDENRDTSEMSHRMYEGCNPLYPATSRLQSVPPRYYDVVDRNTGDIMCSDMMYRSKSVARNTSVSDGWNHPYYNDMVIGSTAHPGHHYPRSSTEFCRDIISHSRSPSPAPEHINHYHRDMISSNEERIHHSNMKNRYPETFRGTSSVYSPTLGRYLTSHDSPSYRYYRYKSTEPQQSNSFSPRYKTRNKEEIYLPIDMATWNNLKNRRKK